MLLDTPAVIAPRVAGLASLTDLLTVSAITVAELEYGIGAAMRRGRAAAPASAARRHRGALIPVG